MINKGLIYILQSGNKLKVGYTKNLAKRIAQHLTSNPDITVLFTKETSRLVESEFHRTTKSLEGTQEWYNFDDYESIKQKLEELSTLFNENLLSKCVNNNKLIIGCKYFTKKSSKVFLHFKTALDYKVIYLLMSYTDKYNIPININKHIKEQIANKLNFSIKAIEKSINSLVKVNAMTPLSRGVYLINPELMYIGSNINLSNKVNNYANLRKLYLETKTDSKYNAN